MSLVLPAGKPTIKRTGRVGQACAFANRGTAGRGSAGGQMQKILAAE
jgi:hypothetical protein